MVYDVASNHKSGKKYRPYIFPARCGSLNGHFIFTGFLLISPVSIEATQLFFLREPKNFPHPISIKLKVLFDPSFVIVCFNISFTLTGFTKRLF